MEQNILSYEEYLRITRMLTMDHTDIEEAFRRMVFNVIGVNCDDHIKNFYYLMDNTGKWTISPAYDLIYSNGLATYGEHKMSINGKNKEIDLNDLAQCGYSGGLNEIFMKQCIEESIDGFSIIGNLLKNTGVSSPIKTDIETSVILNITRISAGLSVEAFPKRIKRKKIASASHEDFYRKLLP